VKIKIWCSLLESNYRLKVRSFVSYALDERSKNFFLTFLTLRNHTSSVLKLRQSDPLVAVCYMLLCDLFVFAGTVSWIVVRFCR